MILNHHKFSVFLSKSESNPIIFDFLVALHKIIDHRYLPLKNRKKILTGLLIFSLIAAPQSVLAETDNSQDISNIKTIIPEISPEPTIEPTISPEPTITPTVTPTPKPTAKKLTSTLELMSEHDYVAESVTGLTTKKASVKTLQEDLNDYGTLYGKGMPYKEYKKAMNYMWTDCTDYKNEPIKVSVDLTKTIDYEKYVSILKKLSRYDGVYLYKIGETAGGKNLYSIEIDIDSTEDKEVFMFTGSIHAREFAGGEFLLKEFADLIQKAQTDEDTMNMLKKYKYVAVPIINADSRENIIDQKGNWKIGSKLWKAYKNGVDGNRNYPGLLWGQLAHGNSIPYNISDKSSYAYYAGDYAGCCSETKAMMKWFYHYVVIEQARYYFDYHQQGRVIYAGKGWQTRKQEKRCISLEKNVANILNDGNLKTYTCKKDNSQYGLQGEGSTNTDYAVSLAVGGKFSPAYGFTVFTDGKKEYPLLKVMDLDTTEIEVQEANSHFAAIAIEIGNGTNYLGNSKKTRRLNAKEYTKYHYSKLLEAIPGFIK